MKTACRVLAAAALLAAAGCEKPQEPEKTTDYDEAIDGPTCMYASTAKDDLLADQGDVAKRSAAARAAVVSTPTAAGPPAGGGPGKATLPAGTDPVQAVRRQLQGAAMSVTAGRQDQVLGLFGDAEAKALRQLLAMSDLQTRTKNLEQLVRDRFGDAFAAKLGGLGGGPGGPGGPPKGGFGAAPTAEQLFGGFLDMAKLKFKADGQDVVVTQPDGSTFKMVYTAKGWKIELEPLARDMFTVAAELGAATSKMIDAVTAGINDGSITKGNFDAKGAELGEKLMKPAVEKFGKILMELMKQAFEKMGGPGGPGAPGPTPPTTTAPAPDPGEI